ncbi:hypothetical protein ACM66B_000782 [Microbotryomycetes sp. NB124-2]
MPIDTPQAATDAPRLDTLPTEVIVEHVCAWLPPQAIVRLSACSRRMHAITRADAVWRRIVSDAMWSSASATREHSNEHEQRQSSAPLAAAVAAPAHGDHSQQRDKDDDWFTHASFLLPRAKYLGYWMSSSPYTSRVIVLIAKWHPKRHEIVIQANQLVAKNQLTTPNSTASADVFSRIPSGCVLDRPRATYLVPSSLRDRNPDAGLSVDLLEPAYEFVPLFRLSPTSSAILSPSRSSLADLMTITADDDDDEDSGDGSSMNLKIEPVDVKRLVAKNGSDSGSEQQRTIADAMFAVFTGQTPDIPWPTPALVGGSSRDERRWGNGAIRGMRDWVTSRGKESDVLSRDIEEADESDSIGFVKGFGLQVRKKARTFATRRVLVNGTRTNDENGSTTRRRGVGANGGPAVLWHGREQDPDQRRGVAVIQTQTHDQGRGFRFRMPGSIAPVVDDDSTEDATEEVVRNDGEEFYPLRSPNGLVSLSDPLSTAVDGDILAASLEGMWLGNYGGHGLEFGHVRLVTRLAQPRSSTAAGSELGRGPVIERELEYIKVTGDANVPSGQPSWKVFLPDHETSSSSSSLSESELNDENNVGEAASVGTIQTITEETFLRWCETSGGRETDWDRVTHPGAGRVALSGYVNPDWTRAQFVFIKSVHTFDAEGGDGATDLKQLRDRRERHVVDEIRVRWPELGKVACFRRVRI